MPDTHTVNGRLTVARSGQGWVAAVAWNDPGVYPQGGHGIKTKAYTRPFPLMGSAVACAIGQWAAEMAMAGKISCMLFIGKEASDGSASNYEKNGTFVVYGAPEPRSYSDPQALRLEAALQALAELGFGENLIKCADGSLAATPCAAVRKFMCPGPCGPDCPLHKSVETSDGGYAMLCNRRVVEDRPELALAAIGAEYLNQKGT